MSSQSNAPPPLLLGAVTEVDALGGEVTVSEVDAPAELPPAGAVESAFAAITLA